MKQFTNTKLYLQANIYVKEQNILLFRISEESVSYKNTDRFPGSIWISKPNPQYYAAFLNTRLMLSNFKKKEKKGRFSQRKPIAHVEL